MTLAAPPLDLEAAPSGTPPEDLNAARRLPRGAMIYGAGIIVRRAATLIMLPIYTRLLTPTDYGLLQMLSMTVDVVAILMSAGTTAGVTRFYFKATSDQGRRDVIVAATYLVLGLNLAGALLLVLASGPIHQHLLNGTGARYLIYIAAANFVLGQLLTTPMLLMQIQGRATLFSATSLAQLLVQLSLNVVLVVGLRLGPLGILLSTLISSLLVGGTAMVWMHRRVGARTSRSAFRDLRRFGVPYQLTTAATFVLQFGDRLFLEASHGLAAVGLYAFAYQFGFLLDQLATGPFMRAWEPQRFARADAPRPERERDDNAVLHALTLTVVSFALATSLFVRPALRIIASPEFYEAARVVPIVVAAFVFQAWGTVVQFGIDAAERTRYVTMVVWASAALIVALYAVLIPRFGMYGAGIATLVSFAARGLMLARVSSRVWPQTYDWGPQLRIFGYAAVIALIDWRVPVHGVAAETLLGAALFGLFVLVVWRWELSDGLRGTVVARVNRLTAFARRRTATA